MLRNTSEIASLVVICILCLKMSFQGSILCIIMIRRTKGQSNSAGQGCTMLNQPNEIKIINPLKDVQLDFLTVTKIHVYDVSFVQYFIFSLFEHSIYCLVDLEIWPKLFVIKILHSFAPPHPCRVQDNVIGSRCDRCTISSFNIDADNSQGCISCFCFGVTDNCKSYTRNRGPVSFTRLRGLTNKIFYNKNTLIGAKGPPIESNLTFIQNEPFLR